MKIFLGFCFFFFSFSAFSQQDSLRNDNPSRRDSIINSRRDSIINAVDNELNIPKGKMEDVLSALSLAVESMKQVAANDDLLFDEKSTQLKSIAERRDATLKSLLNDNQLARLKAYIINHKIPKKI